MRHPIRLLPSLFLLLLGLAAASPAQQAPPLAAKLGPNPPDALLALPDLEPIRLFLARWVPPATLTEYEEVPAVLLAGAKVFLVCEIRNNGPGDVRGTHRVDFRVDGATVAQQWIEARPQAGLLARPGGAWTAQPAGNHTYTCAVDAEGKVKETSEANNLRSMSVQVKPVMVPPPSH
ncbi:MAG: hypothetical protein KJ058_10045 [Thermoanaerobaculia bacterium]|nr:hypothetical protein [Thermoanaerobaculia bacterium]